MGKTGLKRVNDLVMAYTAHDDGSEAGGAAARAAAQAKAVEMPESVAKFFGLYARPTVNGVFANMHLVATNIELKRYNALRQRANNKDAHLMRFLQRATRLNVASAASASLFATSPKRSTCLSINFRISHRRHSV